MVAASSRAALRASLPRALLREGGAVLSVLYLLRLFFRLGFIDSFFWGRSTYELRNG